MYAWSSEYLEIPDSGDPPPYSVIHGVPQDGVLHPTHLKNTTMVIGKCLPQSVEISLYVEDI